MSRKRRERQTDLFSSGKKVKLTKTGVSKLTIFDSGFNS